MPKLGIPEIAMVIGLGAVVGVIFSSIAGLRRTAGALAIVEMFIGTAIVGCGSAGVPALPSGAHLTRTDLTPGIEDLTPILIVLAILLAVWAHPSRYQPGPFACAYGRRSE